MIVDTPVEGYASCCEAVAAHDVAAGLGAVRAPTLVIAGAQDRAIPASQGERIAAAVPDARFELLDPGSHLASVERADEVNRLIAEHWRTAMDDDRASRCRDGGPPGGAR